MAVAGPARSSRTSIVALQAGVETGRPTRTHIHRGAVSIIDIPAGRIIVEHTVGRGGRQQMTLTPGTANNITTAVNQLMRRLPAENNWQSSRRHV